SDRKCPKWLGASTFIKAFDFAYSKLGVAKIEGYVRVSNSHAVHLAKRFGFRKEGVLRSIAPTVKGRLEAVVVFGMLKDEFYRKGVAEMADPVTAIALASAAFGPYQQYQTGKRQERYQRQLEREMAISPEEARQYNELVAQLAWMAGLDPTQFYVQPTGPFEGRTVDLPAPVASTPFRAIDPEAIDEVIAQTQRDLATQAGTLGEQALAMAARRGLAGSSLVDQALAHIGTEMGR